MKIRGRGASNDISVQFGAITLGGSGTTTAFTFAALGMDAMGDANFIIVLANRGTHTVQPYVSARATTGFTVTHDSGSTAVLEFICAGLA